MVFLRYGDLSAAYVLGKSGRRWVIQEPLLQDGLLALTFGSSSRGVSGESARTLTVTDTRSSSYLEDCISSDRASHLQRSCYRAVQPLDPYCPRTTSVTARESNRKALNRIFATTCLQAVRP